MKREVLRKTVPVALEGLVEALGVNSIKARQIGVEYDAMAANPKDQRL